MKKQTVLLVGWRFLPNKGFRAAEELERRGKAEIVDRKKHLLWEWMALKFK